MTYSFGAVVVGGGGWGDDFRPESQGRRYDRASRTHFGTGRPDDPPVPCKSLSAPTIPVTEKAVETNANRRQALKALQKPMI